MKLRIDEDSHKTIIVAWVAGIWLNISITFVAWVFMNFVTWFFRVPTRSAQEGKSLITSVCDGKVVIVKKAFEKEYLKKECWHVAVYMDFFDVHCDFWPAEGEIEYYKYHPGKYLLAFLPKSSDLNEHASSCIKTPSGYSVF